jgi:hypothetical protein
VGELAEEVQVAVASRADRELKYDERYQRQCLRHEVKCELRTHFLPDNNEKMEIRGSARREREGGSRRKSTTNLYSSISTLVVSSAMLQTLRWWWVLVVCDLAEKWNQKSVSRKG